MRLPSPLLGLAVLLFAYALFVLWAALGLVAVIAFAFGLTRLLAFAERQGRAERARVAIEVERRARIARAFRR